MFFTKDQLNDSISTLASSSIVDTPSHFENLIVDYSKYSQPQEPI